ncbi:hypothetical protein WA158_005958 [Blastocystis sp. Blastoise]
MYYIDTDTYTITFSLEQVHYEQQFQLIISPSIMDPQQSFIHFPSNNNPIPVPNYEDYEKNELLDDEGINKKENISKELYIEIYKNDTRIETDSYAILIYGNVYVFSLYLYTIGNYDIYVKRSGVALLNSPIQAIIIPSEATSYIYSCSPLENEDKLPDGLCNIHGLRENTKGSFLLSTVDIYENPVYTYFDTNLFSMAITSSSNTMFIPPHLTVQLYDKELGQYLIIYNDLTSTHPGNYILFIYNYKYI